jgi:E3 ubiquitin-protein ligase DOA10
MVRKLGRFFHDKRAITPVLSNLLLMVVAVAAMAIATTATYVITTNLRETMGERLIAEDLWFNPSGCISIYILNVGKTSIQISAVYVNHTKYSFTPTPFTLETSEHGWLNVSCSWASGDVYHVEIVTKRGYHVADYYKAP